MKIKRWSMLVGISLIAAMLYGGALLVEQRSREHADSLSTPGFDRIDDRLYLGGMVATPPPGTQAVLNLCEHDDAYRCEVHRWRPIRDAASAPSVEWLREQVAFIEEQQLAGRVTYVHCFNGVSRSGMVVVAYLMHRHGWSRDEAMTYVRERRSGLRPNPAFMELLGEWEKRN